MTSSINGEGEIRKALVENNHIECMVALPAQLFYGTQIPACLWILRKNRSKQNKLNQTQTLFIDAKNLGEMISRKQKELTEKDIKTISDTYHNWLRGEKSYQDIPGFCKSVSKDEIEKNDYMLTPGRYVGIENQEEDEISFLEKMQNLVQILHQQMEEAEQLTKRIRKNLEGLGYGK